MKGYLRPEAGVIKVYSNRSGIIDKIYVSDGMVIQENTHLVKIQNSQNLSTGVELSSALSQELTTQIATLEKEFQTNVAMHEKNQSRLETQITQLTKSLQAIKNAERTNQKKLQLKEKQYLNHQKLHDKGFTSASQLDETEEAYLEAQAISDRTQREIAGIKAEISAQESELALLPGQLSLRQSVILREISGLKVRLTELNNQFEFIKQAPEAGTVTAIQISPGTRVDESTPLMSIIPNHSPLEIELLLPTRSAGFVQIGDPVNIRFDAFPYQKFGMISGEITHVDRALVLPTDKRLPVNIDEAVYRVKARLLQQSMHAYGKTFPLKAGMIAEADIILEQRSLLEWILEPLYAVQGKLG
ncbi:HlyD family secretion protein [Photobacterium sp. TLY01]|uniref:HlyD family secretion protein n=1 Tax=Photobacterium sp. TLY01 TaxID=2907534 RepID=UPI001F1727DA|nr:HlyD family efflux transporter periplasmic adaptor subunit [Photobacterium sp. TLY01]UIP28077.1 HlyD family efflux transporter periplasmic adaptor subunit [Photobacterium sp. TLY01]